MSRKRKNIAVIIIIILIISVVACSVAYINSFQIALKKARLNTGDIHVIEECEMDSNGKEFQVIQTYLDDKIAMAIMTKKLVRGLDVRRKWLYREIM